MSRETKDNEKTKKKGGKPGVKKQRKSPIVFFREIVSELKKVTWPSRKELTSHSIAVFVFVVCASLLIGLIDLGLTPLFQWIIS